MLISALLPAAVVLSAMPCAAGETGPPAAARAPVPADPQMAALLQTVERQVSDGHTTAPSDDNAMATWTQVLQSAAPPSPAIAGALVDFIGDARRRANTARDTGHEAVALDLLIFVDLARDLLKEAPAVPGADQILADAPKRRADAAVGPAAPETTRTIAGSPQTPAAAAPPPVTPASQLAAVGTPVTPPSPQAGAEKPTQPMASRTVAALLPPAGADKPAQPVASRTIAAATPPGIAAKPAPKPAAARSPAVAVPSMPPEQLDTFIRRGNDLLAQRDISGARKFYEFAANAGSARGAAALAATYDPDELRRLQVIGLPPNPDQALFWYRRAAELGDRNAGARLRVLQAQAGR